MSDLPGATRSADDSLWVMRPDKSARQVREKTGGLGGFRVCLMILSPLLTTGWLLAAAD